MVELLREAWFELGSLGVLLLCLIYAIYKLCGYVKTIHDDHIVERVEWRKESSQLVERMITSFNRNTEILSELRVLIKTNREWVNKLSDSESSSGRSHGISL